MENTLTSNLAMLNIYLGAECNIEIQRHLEQFKYHLHFLDYLHILVLQKYLHNTQADMYMQFF